MEPLSLFLKYSTVFAALWCTSELLTSNRYDCVYVAFKCSFCLRSACAFFQSSRNATPHILCMKVRKMTFSKNGSLEIFIQYLRLKLVLKCPAWLRYYDIIMQNDFLKINTMYDFSAYIV